METVQMEVIEIDHLSDKDGELESDRSNKRFTGLDKQLEKWLDNIIEDYNNEMKRLYENGIKTDPVIVNRTDKPPSIQFKSSRDLEDGLIIGLAIRYHCPNLLSPHNIPRSLGRKQKFANWEFLNDRVFTKLGFRSDQKLIKDIIDHDKKKIEQFLLDLKKLLERDFPKVPVDYSSSKMMLRPIEKIYDVPAVINSKKTRRKLKTLKGFALLEDCDRKILEEKENTLNKHRICINELQERFRMIQGSIREKKVQISKLESGQIEGMFSDMLYMQ